MKVPVAARLWPVPLPAQAAVAVTVIVVFLWAVLLPSSAQGDDVTEGDGVPTGMVAFFLDGANGQGGDGGGDTPAVCPPGWAPAAEAAGRLIVPVTGTTEVGVAVGSPLMDQEDRKHAHPFSAQLVLPPKSITGADGGNRSGAQAGPVMWTGTSEPAASSLPFIQLLACEKR